jgi:hypothetical protein
LNQTTKFLCAIEKIKRIKSRERERERESERDAERKAYLWLGCLQVVVVVQRWFMT